MLSKTRLPDTHMHTAFSTDSDAPVEVMVEAAIEKGLDIICITDHHDEDMPYEGFRLEPESYWNKLHAVQDAYRGRIRVLIGVELGLQEHLGAFVRSFAEAYPYDYVIGSRHLAAGIDPYYREAFTGSDTELYRAYFEESLACIRKISGFQALGHLDYVVRYGWDREKSYNRQALADVIDAILQELVRRGIALEVNTGGLKSGIGFPNPHPEVLRRYRELGGELVTLGADAHSPAYIGYAFEAAAEMIRQTGFSQIVYFEKKTPHFVSI